MKYWVLVTFIAVIFFLILPNIDLSLSKYIYDLQGGFLPKDSGIMGIIYYSTYVIVGLTAIIGGILYLYQFFSGRSFKILNKQFIIFFILVLFMSPGLMVNGIFKANSGRPRPVDVTDFGGKLPYIVPFHITNHCPHNCSFVSGHASTGFTLMAIGFVLQDKRMQFYIIGILAGLISGIFRIMQGGHFLSDIIFAGIVTYITSYLVYCLIYSKYYGIIVKIENKVKMIIMPSEKNS
ncbi:MAG: phosphatase PAP2 family protein [Pseudomonadota bacterium]